MELQSPLAQQARPNTFTPKIVELYNTLFHDEHVELSEGFWREFFLLRPDPSSLRSLLNQITPDELVHHHQITTQQLLHRAYNHISDAQPPSDTIALDTLTVFLECVLNKKFSSPNSDTIAVLAGLDNVDVVLTEFVAALDDALRDKRPLEFKHKVVNVAISAVAGAYRTGLVSYFITRDLFLSLVKVLTNTETPATRTYPLCLLALMVNYNKFEFQNPYRARIEDLKDMSTTETILETVSATCALCRDQYAAVQEDIPDGSYLGGALSWVGLSAWSRGPQANPVTEEAANIVFSALPSPEAVILLSVYDFTISNKSFRLHLVSGRPTEKQATPFGEFLSFSSYLFQHACRSASAASYSCLNLLTLHMLLSDQEVAARICSSDSACTVRLCRQRQPALPAAKGDRIIAAAVMDTIVAGIEHNLAPQLEGELYQQVYDTLNTTSNQANPYRLFLSVLLRLMTYMTSARTRLPYHWPSLWQALSHLLIHLNTSSQSANHSQSPLYTTAALLVQILALSLSSAEALLPDTPSQDDLFSTLHNLTPQLRPFRDGYSLSASPSTEALFKISTYCEAELTENAKNGRKVPARDIGKVLRQAFEKKADDGSMFEGVAEEVEQGPYREVEWRGLLKRIVRACVEDAKALVARRK